MKNHGYFIVKLFEAPIEKLADSWWYLKSDNDWGLHENCWVICKKRTEHILHVNVNLPMAFLVKIQIYQLHSTANTLSIVITAHSMYNLMMLFATRKITGAVQNLL